MSAGIGLDILKLAAKDGLQAGVDATLAARAAGTLVPESVERTDAFNFSVFGIIVRRRVGHLSEQDILDCLAVMTKCELDRPVEMAYTIFLLTTADEVGYPDVRKKWGAISGGISSSMNQDIAWLLAEFSPAFKRKLEAVYRNR